MAIYQGNPTIDGQREPNGYQQLTSLSSAAALTVPTGTRLTIFQAESQNVRWRDDAVSPTASVGMLITIGSVFIYSGVPSALKFIEVTSGAKLNVSYYK